MLTLYFSTLSHTWHDFFLKKVIVIDNVCFDFLYNFYLNIPFYEELTEI